MKTEIIVYSHLTAKAWGNPNGEKILALHGLQDCAATFDTLVPMLLDLTGQTHYIVSIDLPGHGFSSHLPPGIPYRFMDMLGCIRRVIAQLGWHQFHILGHSLGALLGFYFAATYPESIKKLLTIEALAFRMYPPNLHPMLLRAFGDKLLELEQKKNETEEFPMYTYEKILQKIASGRGTEMMETGLKALASRNINTVAGQENAYSLNLDQRLKYVNFPIYHHEEALLIMSQVKCQVLVVTGDKSIRAKENTVEDKLLRILPKNCSYFKHYIVDGDHDVHLNFPERVAPLIAKFLCEPTSSL